MFNRKTVRRRWPKSSYARTRLLSALLSEDFDKLGKHRGIAVDQEDKGNIRLALAAVFLHARISSGRPIGLIATEAKGAVSFADALLTELEQKKP